MPKFKKPLKIKGPQKKKLHKDYTNLMAGLTDDEYNKFCKLIPTARKS